MKFKEFLTSAMVSGIPSLHSSTSEKPLFSFLREAEQHSRCNTILVHKKSACHVDVRPKQNHDAQIGTIMPERRAIAPPHTVHMAANRVWSSKFDMVQAFCTVAFTTNFKAKTWSEPFQTNTSAMTPSSEIKRSMYFARAKHKTVSFLEVVFTKTPFSTETETVAKIKETGKRTTKMIGFCTPWTCEPSRVLKSKNPKKNRTGVPESAFFEWFTDVFYAISDICQEVKKFQPFAQRLHTCRFLQFFVSFNLGLWKEN